MKLPRRKFLHLAVGAAALPAVARTARAQVSPTQPAACESAAPSQGDRYRYSDGGHAGAGDADAEASRSKSARALRRAHGIARRERSEKRAGAGRGGNARVRRGLIQLAWRFLMFQKDSALARWYRTRTEGPSGARKTTMIVALARKLLIALWRLVTTGEVPDGVELRPAA